MNSDSPFLELGENRPLVPVRLDGQDLQLPDGANLAAALLAAGVRVFRHSAVSGAPRAPYCMMGACFDCLVQHEGVNRQACMMQVCAGLRLTRSGIVRENRHAAD